MRFELGDLVRDKVSGFEGVIMNYVAYLYNCDRAQVQPLGLVDGKPAEGAFFDVPQLELVCEGKVPSAVAPEKTVNLGDTAKDTITGYKGTVMGIATFLNGCYRVGVQNNNLVSHRPVEEEWFEMPRLKLVREAKEAKRVTTGGPMKAPKMIRDPK